MALSDMPSPLCADSVIDNIEVPTSPAAELLDSMHMAPVHRMPPEILSEIFMQCRDTAPFDSTIGAWGLYLDKTLFLLGKICSRWRIISLLTPRLWASFRLSVKRKHLKAHVIMAKTWLARAGTCALSIAVEDKDIKYFSSAPLIQVLLMHCDRWRNVYLCMPISDFRCLSPARNRIPQLQRLLVDVRCPNSPPPTETIDAFEYAPQLHSFNLVPNFPTSLFKVPYHQLKHSDLLRRDADDILKYLSLTPNLETCVVSPDVAESQHPPVLLLNLRYIHIIIGGDLGNFFDKLLFPNLHELSILLWNVPWTAIPQLTLFSRGSLHKFSFYSNPTNPRDGDMIKVLLAAPSLVELDLTGSSPRLMTKYFLSQFARHHHLQNAGAPQLLPALHTIKVDYTPSFFDMLAFAEAVQSRMAVNGADRASSEAASGAYLRTVQIRCFPAYNATESLNSVALSRLQQLRDIGLDLSIIYGRNVFGEFYMKPDMPK
jgi:hypothetical protein